MLPISIQLSVSGNVWSLPSHLKAKYQDLKAFEKKKNNASRSFRPLPDKPEHLKALEHTILGLMPMGSPKNLQIDALNDVIYEPGLNGRQKTYLKIEV